MREECEKLSQRFLLMENDATATEKLYFPMKKLWKVQEETEDKKYIRSLKYLIDQLTDRTFSIPSDRLNFTYLIVNMIFMTNPSTLIV